MTMCSPSSSAFVVAAYVIVSKDVFPDWMYEGGGRGAWRRPPTDLCSGFFERLLRSACDYMKDTD